jgi:translation initiation factor IF-2
MLIPLVTYLISGGGWKIVSKGIGGITENDIKFAAANLQTIVLGFNTKVDPSAIILAERLGIKIEVFSIIYKLSEWVAEIIEERTPKIEVEEERGKIKILKTFSAIKDKQVLGGRVEEGKIRINDEVVIIRREAEIGKGRVRELQQAKNKTGVVEAGNEFGAMIESKIEIVPGDYVKPIIKVVK